MSKRVAPSKSELVARRKAQLAARVDSQQEKHQAQKRQNQEQQEQKRQAHAQQEQPQKAELSDNKGSLKDESNTTVAQDLKQIQEQTYLSTMSSLFSQKNKEKKASTSDRSKVAVNNDTSNVITKDASTKIIQRYDNEYATTVQTVDNRVQLDKQYKEFKGKINESILPKKIKVQKIVEFSKDFSYLTSNKDVYEITRNISLIGEIRREWSTWKREVYPIDKSRELNYGN
ncbi:hypothetical protein [Ligilactobacillus murinus]|uniref:Uncharacterized protein n=1 Tax=Ligilactobacillus murinus TaxID=1622 RepID=A0AAE7BRE0_9LACO|nr:hypothetical protein [Ligilactobacillus murinus]NEF82784.1 hypothetical protein [Ligilactobacillus murinus]NEF84847.1 hypothetical protein [Ligilactobacillus murinus]NEF87340.1 hypothetical protein [Ligilactobacillus murinus]NEF89465.1 hypothetical protein [Ligilactobacillus murinus]NEF91931.1 hypothetical protein [Ligilactobacillus murinus]